MATTRFSKPWPCAEILLGATLSLWRRVHCERLRVVPCTILPLSRGRLRGPGVFERAHVVPCILLSLWRGKLRGSGVVERARVVPCTLSSLSRGRLRGPGVFERLRVVPCTLLSRVAGCGDRACLRHAEGHAAAPCHWDS